MTRFLRNQFTLLLAVSTAACGRDSSTGPAATDASLRLEAVSDTAFEGTVGEPISSVLTVIVKDESGRPVRGIKVAFAPLHASDSAYGDFVMHPIVTTDSRGVASPGGWTLGTMAGAHGLKAWILDAQRSYAELGGGRAIAFRTEAKAGSPARLSISTGDNQVGLPGDEVDPPEVRVTDQFGNGAGGVTVSFSISSGGGSLAKTQGEARWGYASPERWTLGPNPGLNSFVASAPGLNSVTFNARALDAGAITWYDFPQSIPYIVSASIALCENGTFELITVETSDWMPGEWRARQFGKYTVTDARIVLMFAAGLTEEGTVADDRLSIMHNMVNWVGAPLQKWNFVKRK
jgi:hypothetical protein